MAVTVLDRAKANLVYRHPFFASILLRRDLIEDNSIPTAAVDATGQIYYNKQFIEGLNLEQAIFLLCHEVMHMVFQHPARLGHREQLKWNIAADALINDMLKADGIGQMIAGGVDMPGSQAKTTDQIYNELPDPKCSQCGGNIKDDQDGGGQGGQDGEDGEGEGEGDGKKESKKQGKGQGQGNHKHGRKGKPCNCPGHGQAIGGIGQDLRKSQGPPLTADQIKQQEAEMRVTVAQAAQVAKMQGKMPGVIGKYVAELIESKIPWYEKLERYMVSFSKAESTWNKRNRRYKEYLPWVGKIPNMGAIALQIDVSGSISKPELDHYAGHISRIVEQCRPERVHVLYVDTHVHKHLEFDPNNGDEVKLEFYSGGGTDMEEGFRYIEKNLDVEVVVCLTDGYTSFTKAPDIPIVWCISTNVVPTYGEHVPFSIHQTD